MKSIKFKAWIKEEKLMIYFGLDTALSALGVYAFNVFNNKRPPIMQFTGLKDKNGKSVYEGDIYIHHSGMGFQAEDKDGYVVDNLQDFFEDKGLSESEGDDYSKIEVIGNIYENPDIIKTQSLNYKDKKI